MLGRTANTASGRLCRKHSRPILGRWASDGKMRNRWRSLLPAQRTGLCFLLSLPDAFLFSRAMGALLVSFWHMFAIQIYKAIQSNTARNQRKDTRAFAIAENWRAAIVAVQIRVGFRCSIRLFLLRADRRPCTQGLGQETCRRRKRMWKPIPADHSYYGVEEQDMFRWHGICDVCTNRWSSRDSAPASGVDDGTAMKDSTFARRRPVASLSRN